MKIVNNINPLGQGNGIRVDLGYEHDRSRYQIFECNYYNLEAFLNALIMLPINRKVFHDPASSQVGTDRFVNTRSFEEAWNLCRFTQDEGYEQFTQGLQQIRFRRSNMEVAQKGYNVAGYLPNVAKFLNGNPCNMRVKKLENEKAKITVNVECSYSAFTDQRQVVNRGICIINLIEYLEKNGFQVCLKMEATLVCGNQMIIINVPIKRDHERLNIKYAYFPLVNPSFLRRLIFRAMEVIDGLHSDWPYEGYGYPYKKNDEEIMSMENTIYISTPTEMGIEGRSIEKDFDHFVNYIDNKYNLEDMKMEDDFKCHKKVYGKRV